MKSASLSEDMEYIQENDYAERYAEKPQDKSFHTICRLSANTIQTYIMKIYYRPILDTSIDVLYKSCRTLGWVLTTNHCTNNTT